LVFKANVIKVRIFESFFRRDALVRVELEHLSQKVKASVLYCWIKLVEVNWFTWSKALQVTLSLFWLDETQIILWLGSSNYLKYYPKLITFIIELSILLHGHVLRGEVRAQ
jgi:hypothetical protein